MGEQPGRSDNLEQNRTLRLIVQEFRRRTGDGEFSAGIARTEQTHADAYVESGERERMERRDVSRVYMSIISAERILDNLRFHQQNGVRRMLEDLLLAAYEAARTFDAYLIPEFSTRRRLVRSDWLEAEEFDVSRGLLLMSNTELGERIRELASFPASGGTSTTSAILRTGAQPSRYRTEGRNEPDLVDRRDGDPLPRDMDVGVLARWEATVSGERLARSTVHPVPSTRTPQHLRGRLQVR